MSKWLDRAAAIADKIPAEFSKESDRAAAIADKIPISAATTAPHPAIFEKNKDEAPACWNCGALMTLTADIHGKPWFTCNACAVGDGTDRPDGIPGLWQQEQQDMRNAELDAISLQDALELPDDSWEEWLVRHLVKTGLGRSSGKRGAQRRCPKCGQERFATMISVACDDDQCGWFDDCAGGEKQ